MKALIGELIHRSDCGSEERLLEIAHENALAECASLKTSYGACFSYVDEADQTSGEFISAVDCHAPFKLIGHPLHRNLRYREICASNPFHPKVTYFVNHLPPVSMQFYLPRSYPRDSNFVFILDCPWLPSSFLELLTTVISQRMIENSSGMILKGCCQFLQEDALSMLLQPEADGSLLFDIFTAFSESELQNQQQITEMLVGYEEEQRETKFQSTVYECPVCVLDVLGASCVCFRGCRDVVCRECTETHFNFQIRDSAHGGAPTCPNCNEPVRQQEVRFFGLHIDIDLS